MLNLKKIRNQLKINQKEFAEKLGFSRSAISNFESGNVPPSDNFLEKLHEVYGIEVEEYKTYNRQSKSIHQEANGNTNSQITQTVSEHTSEIKEIFKKLLEIETRVNKLEKNK